jgi:hypothetical protein
VLSERYQPFEPIKPGAPFRARDLETAQTVLIHTIGGLAAATAAQILMRADRIKGVFHPSLVTLFAVDIAEPGALRAACEFVPAQTLQRIMGGQAIHPRRAAELVAEVADAVAELHARQFAHGAISSRSVLQTDKGKAKLDLVESIATSTGTEVGDLQALTALLIELAGSAVVDLSRMDSAALAAAKLREFAKTSSLSSAATDESPGG